MLRTRSPTLLLILAISLPIAAAAPFDIAFGTLTANLWYARAALMAVLVVSGSYLGRYAGLELRASGWWQGLVAAVGVAAYVAVLDGYAFRFHLAPSYVAFLQLPLKMRLAYYLMRAFNENVIYRLFMFSLFLALLRRFGFVSTLATASAMTLPQIINIGLNVTQFEHISFIELLYEACRYVAPGILWAWIYRRFGFIAAEEASVGCHVFLQPLNSIIF